MANDSQENSVVESRTTPPTASSKAGPVGVVILAAGLSRRMGTGSKLLSRIAGRTVIGHVLHRVAQAEGLGPVVVVIGPQAAALEAELAAYPRVITVVNHQTHLGMSTSLRAGLEALPPEAAGAFIVLGDQPFFPPEVFQALLAAWRDDPAPGEEGREEVLIAAPVYNGRRGHPVLFSSRLFPELMSLEGDQGGREVLARHRDRTRLVPLDSPLAAWDVDTPDDLERLREAYDRLMRKDDSPH